MWHSCLERSLLTCVLCRNEDLLKGIQTKVDFFFFIITLALVQQLLFLKIMPYLLLEIVSRYLKSYQGVCICMQGWPIYREIHQLPYTFY